MEPIENRLFREAREEWRREMAELQSRLDAANKRAENAEALLGLSPRHVAIPETQEQAIAMVRIAEMCFPAIKSSIDNRA